jgi:hypothetical protein
MSRQPEPVGGEEAERFTVCSGFILFFSSDDCGLRSRGFLAAAQKLRRWNRPRIRAISTAT